MNNKVKHKYSLISLPKRYFLSRVVATSTIEHVLKVSIGRSGHHIEEMEKQFKGCHLSTALTIILEHFDKCPCYQVQLRRGNSQVVQHSLLEVVERKLESQPRKYTLNESYREPFKRAMYPLTGINMLHKPTRGQFHIYVSIF